MNNHGASLIATIFVLVILALFGAALCVLIATEADTGVRDVRARQALGLAEAGIDIGLWNLHKDFTGTWAPDPSVEHPLGKGTFTLELIAGTGGTETLRATGYVPDRSGAAAKRVAEITGDLVPESIHEFFDYALWLSGPTTLDYSLVAVTTSGRGRADLYAGGDVLFRNGSGRKIDGAARSTGTVGSESWSGDDPSRTVEEGVDGIPFPPLNNYARDWYRQNAFSVLQGDQTYQNVAVNLQNGRIYFIEGNLTIGGLTISGDGAMVSGGTITITGTIEYRRSADGPAALVAFGDIVCDQDTDPVDGALYAGGAVAVPSARTIVVRGNLGCRNGLSLADGTSIQVVYDRRLGAWSGGRNALPTSPSRTCAWREVYK